MQNLNKSHLQRSCCIGHQHPAQDEQGADQREPAEQHRNAAFQVTVAQDKNSHLQNRGEKHRQTDHGLAASKLCNVQGHEGIVHGIGDRNQNAEEDEAQKKGIIKDLAEALERQRRNTDGMVESGQGNQRDHGCAEQRRKQIGKDGHTGPLNHRSSQDCRNGPAQRAPQPERAEAVLRAINVAQNHGVALGKQRALEEIEKQYGDIDHFVCICLKYNLG
ncbi:hypothetical protein D3C75_954160 [compost metagenome]